MKWVISNVIGASARRLAHPCCLCLVLAGLAAGLAGCGGAGRFGASEKVVTDLNDVLLYVESGGYAWDLSISPSGQHVLVNRPAVRYEHLCRYELDGVPGPDFDQLILWRWSRDGSACIYRSKNSTTAPKGEFIVYGAAVFGPYETAGTPALSTDGKHWACWVRRPGLDAGDALALLVDGVAQPLSFKADWRSAQAQWQEPLDFDDKTQAFIVLTGPQKWKTLDGRSSDPPDYAYAIPTPPVLPPGVVVEKRRTTNQFKYRQSQHTRTELLLNGRRLGEYDFVFGVRTNYSIVSPAHPQPSGTGQFPGYPQPDGSMIFYAVKGSKLVRLQARP